MAKLELRLLLKNVVYRAKPDQIRHKLRQDLSSLVSKPFAHGCCPGTQFLRHGGTEWLRRLETGSNRFAPAQVHTQGEADGQTRKKEKSCMRLIIAILALGLTTTDALAAESTCKAQVTDKKLAGAALTSFMKKCESDAAKSCETSATEKKLAGAAKTSFTKKCVTDAIGT